MSRLIQDDDLHLWEVYSSTGAYGFPEHSEIVFLCLSDRTRRPRSLVREARTADVEREVERASEYDLRTLLRESHDLS